MNLEGALFLLATTVCTITGQTLMKRGVDRAEVLSAGSVLGSPHILLGVLCYGSGFLLWLKVLRLLPLSVAYPASSVSFIAVVMTSAVFLGERVTAFKLIGVLCIGVGVVLIGLSR